MVMDDYTFPDDSLVSSGITNHMTLDECGSAYICDVGFLNKRTFTPW